MKTSNPCRLFAAAMAAALVVSCEVKAAAPTAPQGVITAKEFLDLGGGVAISDVTNSAKFPNSPDVVAYSPRFEWPTGPDDATAPPGNVKNNYGVQVIGYFYPTTTGPHTFYIAADDNAVLYLSTDSNPANKKLIAIEPVWNPVRAFTGTTRRNVDFPENDSSKYQGSQWPGGGGAINLTANQPYYIEAIMKEGGGGDNVAVSLDGVLPIPGSQLSTIDRTTLAQPFLNTFIGNAGGVWYYLIEPSDTVNQGTVVLKLNGNTVTPTFTKSGTNLTISFRVAAALAAGSAATTSLDFTDSAGRPQSISKSFTVPAYTAVPASYATTTFSGDGMAVFVSQIDFVDANGVPTAGRGPGNENAIYNAETQLAGGFLDPLNNNQPYANVASPPVNSTATTVNWEQLGGDINAADPQPDNFNNSSPPANAAIPSIPGSSSTPDNNIAAAITMYLELKAGWNRLGVNSDDGFTLRASPGAGEVVGGQLLGSFNGGRGAANSLCDFWVDAAGVYPVRLAWWEGDGGANVEFFSENLESGKRTLINDRATTGHLKAYPTGRGRAYAKTVLPYPGKVGEPPKPTVKIQITDDLTALVAGSLTLVLDGSTITNASVQAAGGTTTLTWTPANSYLLGSTHTGYFTWQENTTPVNTWSNALSFTIQAFSPDDLPSYTAGSFWIEAEDFDAWGDPAFAAAQATASTMPYAGDAFNTLGAKEGIDFNNDDGQDSLAYRLEQDDVGSTDPNDPSTYLNEVNITASTGLRYSTRRPGGFDLTANYRIGWVGGPNEWYNYTRKISNGVYKAYVALSFDGTADGQLAGRLEEVTAGQGTTSQTTRQLGSFSAPGSGGWGQNDLVTMKAADGTDATFKVKNFPNTTTLRFYSISGDFDWFVVVPVAGITPSVTAASPANGGQVRRDASLNFTIEDFSTAVNRSTVKLIFDGTDVTSSATITKPADITTVTYDPPGLMGIGSTHTYSLIFSDSGTPVTTKTNTASFTVHVYPTPGTFLIEAEDFNYGGGQTTNTASTMPYPGGAYTNQVAVLGVDYNDNDARDSQPYRGGFVAGQNVNHDANATAGTLDTDRGEWSVTANYKIGWVGAPNWYNYTRTIPANSYQVWAALSHGDPAGTADRLVARLEQVTSDPSQTNQSVTVLGNFNAPSSGGWGNNTLVQMKDSGGNVAVVNLSGVQTLRFNGISGDYDYFLLVPGAPQLRFNNPTVTGTQLNLSWTGTAVLQEASNLTGSPGDWSDTPGVTGSSYSVTVGSASRKFYRLKQ